MNARSLFQSVPGSAPPASSNAINAIVPLSPSAPAGEGVSALAALASDKKKTGGKRNNRNASGILSHANERAATAPVSAHLVPQRSNAPASGSGG